MKDGDRYLLAMVCAMALGFLLLMTLEPSAADGKTHMECGGAK